MAISFNQNSAFDLKPIPVNNILEDVDGLLIKGEEYVAAFKTVRDQLIFTNMRVISVDVQGISGKRRSFTSIPYSKVQYFTVQTPGLLEVVPDSELVLYFANGSSAKFEFRGNCDVARLARLISSYVMS